jgi:DUF1009 family protein
MSAAAKSSITTIGVIAGSGALPERLLYACEKQGIVPFVVGFEGQTDPRAVQGRNHMWSRIGSAGQIISTLKAHQVRDLILIGGIRRPTLMELRPDLKTAEFFARIGLRAIGDNDLLGALRQELEREGFTIHGVHEFAHDLLTAEGVLGTRKPSREEWVDIRRGIEVSQALGKIDVGQAVVVQEGIVLAVEAAEGTDDLMRRTRHIRRQGRGGVLVKTCKPQQDKAFDLPTVGPDTLEVAALAGLAGIAIEAGKSLLIDPQRVAEIANKHKMFVVGVNLSEALSQQP